MRNEKRVARETFLSNQTLKCTHVNTTYSAVGNENGTFKRKPCIMRTPRHLKNFCPGREIGYLILDWLCNSTINLESDSLENQNTSHKLMVFLGGMFAGTQRNWIMNEKKPYMIVQTFDKIKSSPRDHNKYFCILTVSNYSICAHP